MSSSVSPVSPPCSNFALRIYRHRMTQTPCLSYHLDRLISVNTPLQTFEREQEPDRPPFPLPFVTSREALPRHSPRAKPNGARDETINQITRGTRPQVRLKTDARFRCCCRCWHFSSCGYSFEYRNHRRRKNRRRKNRRRLHHRHHSPSRSHRRNRVRVALKTRIKRTHLLKRKMRSLLDSEGSSSTSFAQFFL